MHEKSLNTLLRARRTLLSSSTTPSTPLPSTQPTSPYPLFSTPLASPQASAAHVTPSLPTSPMQFHQPYTFNTKSSSLSVDGRASNSNTHDLMLADTNTDDLDDDVFGLPTRTSEHGPGAPLPPPTLNSPHDTLTINSRPLHRQGSAHDRTSETSSVSNASLSTVAASQPVVRTDAESNTVNFFGSAKLDSYDSRRSITPVQPYAKTLPPAPAHNTTDEVLFARDTSLLTDGELRIVVDPQDASGEPAGVIDTTDTDSNEPPPFSSFILAQPQYITSAPPYALVTCPSLLHPFLMSVRYCRESGVVRPEPVHHPAPFPLNTTQV